MTRQPCADPEFKASPEKPLLFQVGQDLGERIDRAQEQPEQVVKMKRHLEDAAAQIRKEGPFWDGKKGK